MKAVILAAGTATRLRPLTDSLPKCLLDVGGKTLLGRTLETLRSRGFSEMICVTGYREEQIRLFVAREFPELKVEFLSNGAYASTNNIYSLWLTRDTVRGHGMLLLDSDILFDGGIIDLLLRSGHEDCLAVNTRLPVGREEVKVLVDERGGVVEIGKDVDPKAARGESIGIEKFGPVFVEELFAELDQLVRGENKVGIFYETAFQRVIDRGRRPFAVDSGSLLCIEIDTLEDLESARSVVRSLSPI